MSRALAAILASLLLVPAAAYAHTVDAVGSYRLEIGWINEPVIAGAPNGIELYISSLPPGADPLETGFVDGVAGLHKSIEMQLVLSDEKISIPLLPDHDVKGRYHADVIPSVSGFYQVNLIGMIEDAELSLAMHPPKVEDGLWIQFPPVEEQEPDTAGQLEELRAQLQADSAGTTYVAVGIAAAAAAMSAAALARSLKAKS